MSARRLTYTVLVQHSSMHVSAHGHWTSRERAAKYRDDLNRRGFSAFVLIVQPPTITSAREARVTWSG